MKRAIKVIILAVAAGIFSITANAQTDNSKLEKVVLEKMGDSKSVEYSIKPDETKDVAIVEVKIGATLVIKSSQQGPPEVKSEPASGGGTRTVTNNNPNGSGMGNVIVNTSSVVGGVPDTSQAYANAPKTVLAAKTNWILKKDGRQIGNGADGLEYASLAGRHITTKNDSDTVPLIEPGIYVIAVKCIQKATCDDKVSLTLTAGMVPDPANMGP